MTADEEGPVERVRRLRSELADHPGETAHQTLRDLNEPFRVLLLPNAADLDRHLATFPDDVEGEMVLDLQRRELLDAYLETALRLIHNLVAAVSTTIDHTRRVLQAAYPDEGHPVRYTFRNHVDVFATDGELQFIRDLRIPVLHRSLPEIHGHLHAEQSGTVDWSVRLTTESLLAWKQWCDETLTYFDQCGDSVELRPVALNYVEAVALMHTAIASEIEKAEREDLGSFRALADEHDHLVSQLKDVMESDTVAPADGS